MTGERVERRLAAVLAADIAGYSRLMGADEVGTLKALKAHRRELIDPSIADYKGRIVKTTGDGMLVEFPSAVDAVTCAMTVQTKMRERNASAAQKITFRIGINIGDIIIDGNDIYGDGVNVAARVEHECEPGGVFLSGSAFEQVRGKTEFAFDDLGERSLKNIERPVRLYAVRFAGDTEPFSVTQPPQQRRSTVLPLPDKPSIAVLPFQNMSGDPEQEYFADGVVEDIITALSRFKSLFVIARNSSFTYKGKAVDIKQVGRELGVRYVLEGSVRKSAGRVRITGQLIDSATGAHVWVDRFDGKLEDVFELQDQVTASVVGQLMTHVQIAEIERANQKPTANLNAYDCYWKGLAEHWKFTKSSGEAALAYFLQAIDYDQGFASAFAFAATIYSVRKQNYWMVDVARERAEGTRLARRAIELGQTDEMALCRGGSVLAYLGGEVEFGAECIRRGLATNPNYAAGWSDSAWVHVFLGEHQTALSHVSQWELLSPRDPALFQGKLCAAVANVFQGHYEDAASLAEQIVVERPNFVPGWRILALSKALLGDVASANKATKKALELVPSLTASALASLMPLRRAIDVERLKEGYRQAGFPV